MLDKIDKVCYNISNIKHRNRRVGTAGSRGSKVRPSCPNRRRVVVCVATDKESARCSIRL